MFGWKGPVLLIQIGYGKIQQLLSKGRNEIFDKQQKNFLHTVESKQWMLRVVFRVETSFGFEIIQIWRSMKAEKNIYF